ncbi:hypothetical protein PIIN_03863 [Serendipita indica DSM 11827]|uniref:Uncharacterized protein n=1 Tax=Serendipita indica (strain DSM 11827) TaxID=1109443 RepID=G4TF28_SERID|nr:hypothetical protein PIIN_03863 [Serendipita indica DSM 11827]
MKLPCAVTLLAAVLAQAATPDVVCPVYVPPADDLVAVVCPTTCTVKPTVTATLTTRITKTIIRPTTYSCPRLDVRTAAPEPVAAVACPTWTRSTSTLPCSVCTAFPTTRTVTAVVTQYVKPTEDVIMCPL